MKLIESNTFLNLAKAFAGECQAQNRYKFLEYGARMDGYHNIADIIDKLVYQEFNHARMFYMKIQDASKETIENINICSGYPFKEKWDLQEGLRLEAENEFSEGNEIYPEFAQIAREEGFGDIADLFDKIANIEINHYEILKNLYEKMKNNTLYKSKKPVVWECYACGYKAEGTEPWETCPVCQSKREKIVLRCCANSNGDEKWIKGKNI